MFKSPSKELKGFIDTLNTNGLFSNVTDYLSNKKIYRGYFNNENNTVCLDRDLLFPESYKYYSIRSMMKDSDSEFKYYTGVASIDGDVSNNYYIDMDEDIDNGVPVSRPGKGTLKNTMNDKDSYVVEFLIQIVYWYRR